MENLWNILSGAPWWVYFVFVYLVTIGVKATKPRLVPIKRVVLLPFIFVLMSFYALYAKVNLGFSSLIPLWIISLAVGACLGAWEVRAWKIVSNHHEGVVTIPGNYSTLVLVLLIFILKFFWGYVYATRAEIPYWIYFADTLSSALVTGFFIGRAAVFFKRYQSKS